MAKVFRDGHGIPHVRGRSLADVGFGQGWAVAHDRAWQLEWLRRRVTSETTELVGDGGRAWDDFARRNHVADTGRRAFDALGSETKTLMSAYVAGINAGLRNDAPEFTALGIGPEPWPEWMPVATFHAQHILFANAGQVLWQRHAQRCLGEHAELLSYEPLDGAGSNAWAVGGRRTVSGAPLIGGDPHRNFENPGGYYQVGLACDDGVEPGFDVLGFSFVGVPGIQHFGHAGEVAWAITNGSADYQDVEPDGTLSDPATTLGDLGLDALPRLLRARTVADVDAALDCWVAPVNNVVIADTAGAVRYRLAGKIPAGDGWLDDVNRRDYDPDEAVVTANERRGPESDPVGSSFAPPHRASRIADLIDEVDLHDRTSFAAIHRDVLLPTLDTLRRLVPGEFDDFDGHMRADSSVSSRFAAWRAALVRRVADHPALAALHESTDDDPVFRPFLDATSRIALALPNLVERGHRLGIDMPALAAGALEDIADHDPNRVWGETHRFDPVHVFDLYGIAAPEVTVLPQVGLSGDVDCVNAAGTLHGQTDASHRGSVARYVWDLADRDASGWVVPLGASGDPADPHHHDQLATWAEGELLDVMTDWDELRLEAEVEE